MDGRWMRETTGFRTSEYFVDTAYRCSVCGRSVWVSNKNGEEHKADDLCMEMYPYCHCGAKMQILTV